MLFIAFLGVLGIIFCFIILHRNEKVYKYRSKLSDNLFKKDDWKRRLEIYDSIDYDEMVYKFWKPLDSFYDLEELLGDKKDK